MPLRLVICSPAALVQPAMTLVAFLFSATQATGQEAIAGSRVRSESSSIRVAITDGHKRSPTFRSLVAAIDATDGVLKACGC